MEEYSQTESENDESQISLQARRTQKKKVFSDFTDNFSDTDIQIPKVPAPKKNYTVLSNYRKENSQSKNCEKSTIKETTKQKSYSEEKGNTFSESDDVCSGTSSSSSKPCSGCKENRG